MLYRKCGLNTECSTYQSWWTGGVRRLLPGTGEHGFHFISGEVTRVNVGSDNGGKKSLFILQFSRNGFLQGSRIWTLLHSGQYTGLFSFRDTSKSHSCNKETQTWIRVVIKNEGVYNNRRLKRSRVNEPSRVTRCPARASCYTSAVRYP